MQTALATLFEEESLSRAPTPLPEPLRRRYGGDLRIDRGTVYANFVTSLDGVVAIDPETPPSVISGKSDTDRFVMGLLRAFADAIVVGAGTLRAEPKHLWTPGHIYPDAADAFAELRASSGLAPEPQLFVLTRQGDIDPNGRAFQRGAVVVTTEKSAARLQTQLPSASRAIGVPTSSLTVRRVLEVVRSQGHRTVLTEGGPTVLGEFLKDSLLDELFLTLSPRIAGRNQEDQRLGLVEGFAYEPPNLQSAALLSAKQDGSHLFLRYRIEG
ncbi:MAG TPA: dihydrofolate reductase family protein [Actinomycetota bacterium]